MSTDTDFATGKPIALSKPEEVVRQDFEQLLHNDYRYPKECMDIEVPIQMGSSRRVCDIAIYDSPDRENLVGIIETKSPKDQTGAGMKQLESYMSAQSTCYWGVWTNGNDIQCARKDKSTGRIEFNPAYTIPTYGEGDGAKARIKSYDDLRPASDLKWIFRIINNRLYANTNLPRSEKQGAEMVRLIFSKLSDEYYARESDAVPRFQIYEDEPAKETRKRIDRLWADTRHAPIGSQIFGDHEKIEIDDYSLHLVVSTLQGYSLLKTNRDVVGDAFEVFSEKQFAGEKGQFFTPRSVVSMIVRMVSPKANETILDPACGSGGFLVAALNHLTEGKDDSQKRDIAEHSLHGIDKEADLSKICKAHMSILGDGKSNIVTADSLDVESWGVDARAKFYEPDGTPKLFDIVVTNPPFGSKIKVEKQSVLAKFELGRTKTPPQVLFIERCIGMLKPGGRLGIVLPDGILGNPRDAYIRDWILKHAEVQAVIDCPTETFMPHTGTKTSVLILRKLQEGETSPKCNIFFAIAEHCGHTFRGNDVRDKNGQIKEDFSAIANNFLSNKGGGGYLGFRIRQLSNNVLTPRYYDPRLVAEIGRLKKQQQRQFISLRELQEDSKVIVFGAAATAKAEEYDLHGTIRYIRTADVSAFELSERPQKMVSVGTYNEYKDKQQLRLNDILFVKDGDNRIGETAILSREADLHILVQTHFKIIRALDMDPYLLLYLLNTPIVRKQIRQRIFIQSTLGTIGDRIMELLLPFPPTDVEAAEVAEQMRTLVEQRRTHLACLRGLLTE